MKGKVHELYLDPLVALSDELVFAGDSVRIFVRISWGFELSFSFICLVAGENLVAICNDF